MSDEINKNQEPDLDGELSPAQREALFRSRIDGDELNDHDVEHPDESEGFPEHLDVARKLPMPEGVVNSENVLGVDIATQKPIIKPKKSDEAFVKEIPSGNKEAKSTAENIKEMLRQIANTGDFEPFDLPSRGLLYKKDSPLSDGSVLVRPWRAKEEEILSDARMFKTGEAIEAIFRRCIMFESRVGLSDPLELLSLDRMALLIMMRIKTYGPMYDFSVICGNCRKSFLAELDLDEDIDIYPLEDENAFVEPIRSVFPECGFEFTYRLSRGYDEKESLQLARDRERKSGGKAPSESFIDRAKRLVVSVGGFSDREAIDSALEIIKGADIQHLRECIDNTPFGVDTRIVLDCPYCEAENRMRLPVGADFFIPRLKMRDHSSD